LFVPIINSLRNNNKRTKTILWRQDTSKDALSTILDMLPFDPFFYKHSKSPMLRSWSAESNVFSGSIFTLLDTDEKCMLLSSMGKADSALRHGGKKHLTTNTIT